MNDGIGQEALEDTELYANLRLHRERYIRVSGMDYDMLHPAKVAFIPPAALLELFRQDYAAMQVQMIYTESPSFDEMMIKLNELTERLRELK